jgi:protein gp37
MSDNSKIEWTEATWNPVTGCTKVSPGCDHCYAETFAERWRGIPGHHFEQGFDVRLWHDRLEIPVRWKRPRRIFVNSMSDLFHEKVPDGFIARIFAVMASAPQHTFQVLTKRHGRMRSLLGREDFWLDVFMIAENEFGGSDRVWPLPNLWLGVSAEDQHWAQIRVHALLATSAAVRWVSAEPLLGPIDLRNLQVRANVFIDALCGDVKTGAGEIYAACPGSVVWVVAGGESGAGARPMHPDWARSLRDQCQQTRTPYLFKQWGAHRWVADSRWDEPTQCWVDDGIVPQRVPRKLSGRELDGRTWDEFPGVAQGAAA